ncbi:hypothetical protein [Paludibaculum fermentans]|uniref:hypothetical protein n=1 Tax=Paludibaculum fermentans TaxID=1473598 RepID=UPI003EBC1AEB
MPMLWRTRFEWLQKLGLVSLVGMVLLIAAALASDRVQGILLLIGILTTLPGFFYLFICTIWHWKSRYRGSHSDLWGALLLIEASGWFKLVYLFRHIIPDARQVGRYGADNATPRPSMDDSRPRQS